MLTRPKILIMANCLAAPLLALACISPAADDQQEFEDAVKNVQLLESGMTVTEVKETMGQPTWIDSSGKRASPMIWIYRWYTLSGKVDLWLHFQTQSNYWTLEAWEWRDVI